MKKIQKISLFVYTFFLIYMPQLEFINPILKQSYFIVLFTIINIIIFNRKLLFNLKKYSLLELFFVFFLLFIYLLILNLLGIVGSFDFTNLWPLIQFCCQIINLISILFIFERIYETKDKNEFLKYLLKISLFQAILIFLMAIFPNFKEVANLLYTQGQPLPTFIQNITKTRIYGIGSDYTVMLPFVQALFAVYSLNLFFSFQKLKFLALSFVLIASSFLNNRTGLYIYLIIFCMYSMKSFLKNVNFKNIMFGLFSIIIVITSLFIFSIGFPDRYDALISGFIDIFSFLFTGEASDGDLIALTNEHVVLPKGWHIIFGTGQKIYGNYGFSLFGFASDIGYINDLFKGGIIYTITLYGTLLSYIYRKMNDKFLSMMLILYLLIANYKASILTASPMLVIIIIIIISEKYIAEKLNNGLKSF